LGGANCTSAVGSCNNTIPSVFAVYGGLCIANATAACPAITDGSVKASGTITASAFDLAERFISSENLEAGDIAVIGPDSKDRVKKSTKAYDTSVAGIVSTKPGFILGWEDTAT